MGAACEGLFPARPLGGKNSIQSSMDRPRRLSFSLLRALRVAEGMALAAQAARPASRSAGGAASSPPVFLRHGFALGGDWISSTGPCVRMGPRDEREDDKFLAARLGGQGVGVGSQGVGVRADSLCLGRAIGGRVVCLWGLGGWRSRRGGCRLLARIESAGIG